MADLNRAASFAKKLNRKAGRARELLRQNLGKADKTKDEVFDEYVNSFIKQTCSASKLLKEVKNYHNCLKAMQAARKSLMEIICDLYEAPWVGHDQMHTKAAMLDRKFEEYQVNIGENIIKDIVTYTEVFPEVNKKIEKRRKKLLDYDRARHAYESLDQNQKKREEAKIAKAKEQMIETQTCYETINTQLHQELPAILDSRISFLAGHMQSFFHTEKTYHSDVAILFTDLVLLVEKLANENIKGTYTVKRPSWSDSSDAKNNGETEPVEHSSSSEYMSAETLAGVTIGDDDDESGVFSSKGTLLSVEQTAFDDGNTPSIENKETKESKVNAEKEKVENKANIENNVSKLEESGDTSTPPDQPKVLYQVKAAYQYTAEDADELSFEPGEIINVIEFEDPDLQEEGWLMGFKDGVKGVFPSNFTKPI